MKRIRLLAAALLALTSVAFSATLTPIQLLNPAGSTSGQLIVSTGPSTAPAWGNISVGSLAAQAANSVLANATGSAASPTAVVMPSCSTANSALKYTSGTGFSCGTTFALTSGTLAQFATTTSAQLAGIISDETGTAGSLVFSVSPALTGTPTAPTATAGTNTTQIATTAFVANSFAPLASPTFTGTATVANLTASGTLTGFPGRLINVRQFTSTGTYTPTAGTNAIIVEVQSASGGSGGTAATAAGQNAASSGGGSGNFARVYVTSAFSGVTITIGAVGAAGTAGGAGGNAAATSFGSIVSCPGGNGGAAGTAISAIGSSSGGAGQQSTACTISGASTLVTYAGAGTGPGAVFAVGGFVLASAGANSMFGQGGNPSGGTSCNSGTGFGAGPSGLIALASSSAAVGCAGRPAIVVIYEFS